MAGVAPRDRAESKESQGSLTLREYDQDSKGDSSARPTPPALAPAANGDLSRPLAGGSPGSPGLSRHRSLGERTVGEMTVDGLRHSCLTLTSTALGGGLLAVSYVIKEVGVGLGVIMLSIGATMAYLSTVALMNISTSIGQCSYAGLFSYCAGPKAGPILDAMLFIYGNGSCVGYLVFPGDFIPALVKLAAPGAPAWIQAREFGIILGGLAVMPMAIQKDLKALRHMTPISILALVYAAVVIAARCPHYYEVHDAAEYGEIKYFGFSLNVFNAFAICVFAFNCHLNVVPVAGRLVRPTKTRIRKVAWWVNGIQLAFYALIGVTGYLTFLSKTPQDILKGFEDNDPFMAVGRVLLSFTMIIAIPINIVPTVRSGLQIRDYFFPESAVLQASPRASPTSTPPMNPRRQLSPEGATPYGEDEPAFPRIALALCCLVVQVGIAIAVPGVADVISLLGATVATAMMLIIPAYAIGKVLPATMANRAQQVVLIFFACISGASVPVKVLQMGGVISN